ncbi:40S ribosomal protein S5-like [Hibiscus syriacus]|uniref:40S ribosomal protein S5-like n=1 Tax=Hibiscus syriacus TaxID=106335 RepID=A0A6A2ZVT8_HIBSY|nr:40S ribosomal protein S5-like [Hibiscus syriacus]
MPKDTRVRSFSLNRSRASPYMCSSGDDVKLWDDAMCPICLEIPHNAVLLRCSSSDNGCRPFMCNTSYRHSNCLDQFTNSSLSSPSTSVLRETHEPELLCPLCRGEIHGWTVIEPARQFLNNKARSCSSEKCDFRGTYRELRKHARSAHPNVRPTEVDEERRCDWTRFELERDHDDMLSSIQHFDLYSYVLHIYRTYYPPIYYTYV